VIRDGKIAWIGHPMQMDEPLAKIVAGDWEPKQMAATRLAAKAKEKKMTALQQKVYTPYRAKDWKATLSAIDEVSADEPELADQFDTIKFAALCNGGDVDAGLALGEKLLEQNKDQGMALNNIFWYVIDPELEKAPDPRVARLALKGLRLANELTEAKDMAVLDSLANALYSTGDAAGSVEAEEKALKILEAEAKDRTHPYFKQFGASLEKFRKAAANAAK